MAKGKAKSFYLDGPGQAGPSDIPSWDFIYRASTVRDEKYHVGDRVVTPDGRVFHYALAGGTCNPEVGAYQPITTITNAVLPTQVSPASAAVGSDVVTVTVGATDGAASDGVVAADELRGGYVVLGNGSAQHPQMRYILGNTAVASGGGTSNLTLDAPLNLALTVSTSNVEVLMNPYDNLKGDNSGGSYVTFMGVPARVATSGQYFWLQTWGPCWITSDGNTCDGASDRMIYFVANGSVVSGADATIENGYQFAGVAMDASSSGNSNAPFVMLMVAP